MVDWISESVLLQHAFRYGDPVFVAAETLEQLKHENKISKADEEVLMGSTWWLAMLTTRALLTHAIYIDDKRELLLPLIANIRNVLRTLDVDICAKDPFEPLRGNETVWYQPLEHGKFWLSSKAKRTILQDLRAVTFADMNDELIALRAQCPGVKRVFDIFGRAVHELVGSRDTGWHKATRSFKDVADV
jgi:hypothetical protein